MTLQEQEKRSQRWVRHERETATALAEAVEELERVLQQIRHGRVLLPEDVVQIYEAVAKVFWPAVRTTYEWREWALTEVP